VNGDPPSEDLLEEVRLGQDRIDMKDIPAGRPQGYEASPDTALQALDELRMPFVEPIRQAQQRRQLSDAELFIHIKVSEVPVIEAWERSAVISGNQADDSPFFPPKRQIRTVEDNVASHFVVIPRVLRLADVMEHCRGAKPYPLGVAHAMQRLKRIEQSQDNPTDLIGMIRLETIRLAELGYGTEYLGASQNNPSFTGLNDQPPTATSLSDEPSKGSTFL